MGRCLGVDHSSTGQLQPIEVVAVHHLVYLLEPKDLFVPLERYVLVYQVLLMCQPDVVSEH